MKTLKVLAIVFNFAFCALSFNKAVAQTLDPDYWQRNTTGLQMSESTKGRVGGLGFIMENQGWPNIYTHGGAIDGGWSYMVGPSDIPLGIIKPTGVALSSGVLLSQVSDWSHNLAVFWQDGNSGSQISVDISRLAPAIFVNSLATSLDFLTGPRQRNQLITTPYATLSSKGIGSAYPKYAAYPASGGIQIVNLSSAESRFSDSAGNWLLVWYGDIELNADQSYAKGSYYLETKVPFLYPYYKTAELMGRSSYMSSVNVTKSNTYQTDIPLLFVFENAPSSIRHASDGGITLSFPAAAGSLSVAPLLGRDHPKSSDTENWRSGLPSNIISRITKITCYSCYFPSSALESYAYEKNTDTVKITERISYRQICSSGKKFAPLPSVLALAKDPLGRSLEFSQAVVDLGIPTEFGPSLGIEDADSYDWKVSGLRKYTDNARVISNNNIPAELSQELSRQVNKVISAGHLRPWVFGESQPRHDTRGDVYWANPADNIYLLSEIAPVLSEPDRSNLIQYIKNERSQFPPETTYNLSLTQGAIRDSFSLTDSTVINHWISGRSSVFLAKVPIYNFFSLAEYYALTGEDSTPVLNNAKAAINSSLPEQDWATMFWLNGFNDRNVSLWEANRYLSGLIGAIRLNQRASLPDAETENLSRALMAKALVARIAMSTYTDFLYDNQLILLPSSPLWQIQSASQRTWGYLYNFNWAGKSDDFRNVINLHQFGVSVYDSAEYVQPYALMQPFGAYATSPFLAAFRDMAPEVARVLNDFIPGKLNLYINKVEELYPHWYLPFSDQYLGTEHNISHPIDSYQNFAIRSFLRKDSAEQLAKYASFFWLETGDFFYMHKLAETIKAYQGWKWEDEIMSPGLTGDVNQDALVNVLDIQACVNHILGIQNFGSRADVNGDGSVNVLDVQNIVNIILGV